MSPAPPRARRGPAAQRGVALLAGAAALAWGCAAAWGQGVSVGPQAGQEVLFVPPLGWALGLGVGAESRSPWSQARYRAPEAMLSGRLGARLHLDGYGAHLVGAYAWGVWGLPDDELSPPKGTLAGGGVGLEWQARGMNDLFEFGHLGAFVELGALQGERDGGPDPQGAGWRALVGVELGFGLLAHLDPYLYGETGVRLGVERMSFGGAALTSVWFGWQLRTDWAQR